MKRLLIIGSREFIVGAMDFTATYAPGLSALGMLDSAIDVVMDVRQTRPDIIVLDGVSNLPRAIACVPDLRAQAPDAPLIVVVDRPEDDDVALALDAGAVVCAQPPGMRPRSRDRRPDPWTTQLRSVTGPTLSEAGVSPVLTRREHEIMEWVAAGHTNAKTASSLWVTEQTVKFHLTNIFRKLGVANRSEASQYVIEHGLVSQPAGGDRDGAGATVRPLEPAPGATVGRG